MIGETIGNYRVTSKLGEGGMGVVYLAEHQSIGRKAAIKVLLPELSRNPAIVQRFFNEARATTMIKHPGLVDIFDFGSLPDGSAYIAMEFLEGQSLSAAIQRHGRMPLAMVVALGRQAAAALAAAHEKGIVHRDLKPDNIYLVPDAEVIGGLRVKILDFGIAKLTAGNSDAAGLKTRTGAMMGTPVYMSPEQAKSSGEVDHRSDIYSLGCVLYQMACGRPPFDKGGFGEVIAAHLYETPPAPRSIDETISPALEAVLLRSLAKKTDDRQQSMNELKGELDALVGARVSVESAVAPLLSSSTVAPTLNSQPGTATPTTLGSAAAEVESIGDGAPKRSGAIFGIGFVAVAAAVALVVFLRGNSQKESPHPATPATTSLGDKSAAAPSLAAPPGIAETVKPSAAKRVHLRIESDPPGATIVRGGETTSLGVTPKILELDAAPGMVDFELALDGYRHADVRLALDRDGSARPKLAARGGSGTSGSKKKETGEKVIPAHLGEGTYDPFK